MDILILDVHPKEDGRIQRHIKYLVDKGLQVYRLHFNVTDTSITEEKFSEFGEKGFRITISRFSGKLRILNFLIYCIRHTIAEDCYSALNNLGFDPSHFVVIHVHDPQLLPLARMLVRDNHFQAKIVYDRHEIYEKFNPFFGIHILHIFERLAGGSVSGIVTVSESHTRITRDVFPESSIITVPNYPSADAYDEGQILKKIQSFDTSTGIEMIYIGSLNNLGDRDVGLLLKIADQILTSSGNVTFIVGGTYNLDPKCRKKMEDLTKKFKERFVFLGLVSRQRTIEYTQAAHIGFFLLRPDSPYWVVSSPNKVYEYLICGTIPVIRADIDQAEVISQCGLLFNRYDSDDSIIKSVTDLILQHGMMKERMKSARDLGVHYSWESAASRYMDLYQSLRMK